jgi:hypothetical protein
MNIDEFLMNFEKVKKTGNNQWVARSPCRDDRTPSLAIRWEDGKILLHDFGGSSPMEILDAIGLKFEDLFDDNKEYTKVKRSFSPMTVLETIVNETLLVSIAALELSQGKELSQIDRDRLLIASRKIREAYDNVRG